MPDFLMSNLALAQAATQAAQSATSTASHYADQQINQAQQMMQAAAANVAATAASALQSNINQTKNAVAEATAKASALAETASNLGQKIIDTIPKIPMNITESLNTKIGKVVAGINPSELAQEINSGKFIKTAFMGRSIDAMGTQDIYGINKSGATNLAPDNDLSVVAHDIIRILVDEKTLKDKLPTITKNASGSFDLSPNALTERVKGCLGNSSAAVNALGSTLTNMATSGLNGATAALMNQFEIQIGNVVSQCTANSVADANGLLNTLNRLTSSSDIAHLFDVGAEASLLTSLFQESIALRLPDAVSTLVTNADSNTAVGQALRNVLTSALMSGDIATTNTFADLMGSNQILAMLPNAASAILSNYAIRGQLPQSGLASEATALLALLTKVDPNWDSQLRGSTEIPNLAAFYDMSDDAKRVLETQPDYREMIQLGSFYGPESYMDSVTAKYPMCPVV